MLKKLKNIIFLTPPPNLTGKLHIGHFCNLILQDFEARRLRLLGHRVECIPGFDHSALYAEILARETIKTRDEHKIKNFINSNSEKIKEEILAVMKQVSRQKWDKVAFTMNDFAVEEVQKALKILKEKGYLYEDEFIANWDPKAMSVLSDCETYEADVIKKLYTVGYKLEDSLEIIYVATTRPDTISSDVALAINPNDERYHHLIGKRVINPVNNEPLPIICDEAVHIAFGTGVLKITPCFDRTDFEIAKRHGIKIEKKPKPVMSSEDVARVLNLSYVEFATTEKRSLRTEAKIEQLMTTQLFFRLKMALEESKSDILDQSKLEIAPEWRRKELIQYIEKAEDWCISRQNFYGHVIPKEISSVGGVLDTWFSSALWPSIALKGRIELFKNVTIVTGKDIMFFWIIKMIAMCKTLYDILPFERVCFHGLVCDEKGAKMSKSKGNAVELEGMDLEPMRLAFLAKDLSPDKIRFDKEKILDCKAFLFQLELFAKQTVNFFMETDFTDLLNVKLNAFESIILTEIQEILDKVDKIGFMKSYWQFKNVYQAFEVLEKKSKVMCRFAKLKAIRMLLNHIRPLAPKFALALLSSLPRIDPKTTEEKDLKLEYEALKLLKAKAKIISLPTKWENVFPNIKVADNLEVESKESVLLALKKDHEITTTILSKALKQDHGIKIDKLNEKLSVLNKAIQMLN